MEAATIWRWVRIIFRWYIYFTLVIWLTSALTLLYLMHVPGSDSSASASSLDHPTSSTGPLSASGPHRLHALMTASTATFHTNLRTALNTTRTTYHTILHSLPPSLHPLTEPLVDGLDVVLSVVEEVVDDVCLVMRELADEWLVQTVEMMEELRERQNDRNSPSTRSLPWQQQRLDVGGDSAPATQQQQQQKQQHRHQHTADATKQHNGKPAAASAGSRPAAHHPSKPSPGITTPIVALHRSALPDGSVVFVSPLASDDAAFSLSSIATAGEGAEGEQRVAVSLKDGLVRVTRMGEREELDELLRHLRGDQHRDKSAASAA